MKLNEEILTALKRAIKHYGNTSQFADRIGVAHSTVLFWLSGKTTNISGRIWSGALRRELRPFMQSNTPENSAVVREGTVTLSGLNQKVSSARKEVCLTKYSDMLQFDSTVESPVSFIRSISTETAVFVNEKLDSFFALELDLPAAGIRLPKGAKMLLSGHDYAQDGDVVIGKLRNPVSLFLCHYRREGDLIRLQPLDQRLKIMEWRVCENAEKVFWMYPVEEIHIDLLQYRWEAEGLVPRSC